MRARVLAALLALIGWAGGPAALAACGGADMMDELARTDPAAHAAILAEAGAVANGQGRLWLIERPGAAPSHIFGTFHAGKAIGTVPDEAWAALHAARIAVAEVSLDEMAAMEARIASDPGFAFDLEGPALGERLPADDLAVIARALATRGVPLAAAERMRPWLLYNLLAFPACQLAAMQAGEKPLDTVILERARAAGIPQVGLENYAAVIELFRSLPEDRLLASLVDTSALIGREEDIFRTTLELYARGHIAAIDKFVLWLTRTSSDDPDGAVLYREVLDTLVGRRNRAWLPALERELARGNAFVAVGALHLPGADGLLEMLRQRGWTVTPAG